MQTRDREQCIRAIGGLAIWNRLTLDQKLERLRQRPASEAEVQLARKLFSGKASREAQQYHAQDPVAYARLRLIHQEL